MQASGPVERVVGRPFGMTLDNSTRSSGLGVAGILRTGWFNQQDVGFLLSHGAMLDALGHHEHLSRAQGDVPIPHLDGDSPLSTRKKSSVLSCLCQTNAPLTFTTMEVVPIELANGSRLPVLREGGELLREIDGLHFRPSPMTHRTRGL